jgi:adenylyltransferase/sulfurtransferase
MSEEASATAPAVPPGARVLLVGVGGLGSPVALALAESGLLSVLTLIDPDRVELSNLHRQILLRECDLGSDKVLAATATLRARLGTGGRTERLAIAPRALRLDAENAEALLRGHDLVIEGSDDLRTKFVVNDSACRLGIPALIGGVVRFSGQIVTVWPGAACYRCLFEEPPAEGLAQSCQQAGVLGPACGVVAGLMAAEAVRILGAGKSATPPSYAGAALTLDLLHWQARTVPIGRRRDCSACQQPMRTTDGRNFGQ